MKKRLISLKLTPKKAALIFCLLMTLGGISLYSALQIRQNKIKRQITDATRALNKAIEDRDNYVKTSVYFIAQNKLDSLNYVNENLQDSAYNAYADRLDKEYNLGTFYSARELSKLNQSLSPFFKTWDPDDYYADFVKNHFPLTPNMTLRVLEDLIMLTDLSANEIKDKFGIFFVESYLTGFTDAKRETRFTEYNYNRALADAYVGKKDAQDKAILKIRNQHKSEIAKMERINNQMDKLQNKIANEPWQEGNPDIEKLFVLNGQFNTLQAELEDAMDAAALAADSVYTARNGGLVAPGQPNFNIPENAKIKEEYLYNLNNVNKLTKVVELNKEETESQLFEMDKNMTIIATKLRNLQNEL